MAQNYANKDEVRATTCVNVALLADLPFTQRLSIQPEAGFLQKGFAVASDPFTGQGPLSHFHFDYLEASLLAKFYLGQEPARPHLLAGPSLGMLLGGRIRSDEAQPFAFNYKDGHVTALDVGSLNFSRLDPGLQVGMGMTFSIGASWLFLEARYQWGFSDVFNGLQVVDINGAPVVQWHGHNRTLMANLGVMIPVCGSAEKKKDKPAQ